MTQNYDTDLPSYNYAYNAWPGCFRTVASGYGMYNTIAHTI